MRSLDEEKSAGEGRVKEYFFLIDRGLHSAYTVFGVGKNLI